MPGAHTIRIIFVYIIFISCAYFGLNKTETGSNAAATELKSLPSYEYEINKCANLGITAEMVAKSRFLGNSARWHQVTSKMKNNAAKVKVAVIGGSVPAGHECAPGQSNVPNHTCAWPNQFQNMLLNKIEVHNLARGSTPSRSALTQIMNLLEYDVIIISFTTNDDNYKKYFNNQPEDIKSHFESLIRTALALPKNPAVILFEDFGRHLDRQERVAELMHYAVASMYDIPVISASGAFKSTKLYLDKDTRPKYMHIKETWHSRLACLIFENWILEMDSTLDMSGEDTWIDAGKLSPVFGGTTLQCNQSFAASAFDNTLQNSPSHIDDGWTYYADAPQKYGFISNVTDSTLEFDVDLPRDMKHRLFLHYLRSYTPEWGTARIEILGTEKSALIDSRTDVQESQLDEVSFELDAISYDSNHTVKITNIKGKVKIIELFLFSCDQT